MGIIIFFAVIFVLFYLFSLSTPTINDEKLEELKKRREIQQYNEIERENRFMDEIRRKTDELRKRNKLREKESNKLRKYADTACQCEKDKDLETALNLHLKAYEFGHNSEILHLGYYSNNIKRAIILYGKLKRYEDLKEFLEKVIDQYPQDTDAKDWIVRLSKVNSKLNNTKFERKPIKQIDVDVPKAEEPKEEVLEISTDNIGKKIKDLKSSLPEFDFYYKLKEGETPMNFLGEYVSINRDITFSLRAIKDNIDTLIKKARVYENTGDYDKAIDIYNRLINENIENKEPHKRLMIIYRKLKDKNKEIQVIKNAISFFDTLRTTQKEYVLGLAKKYGKEDFALDYINNGKPIRYYMGTFDLYNPNPDIEKWEERLEKLNS